MLVGTRGVRKDGVRKIINFQKYLHKPGFTGFEVRERERHGELTVTGKPVVRPPSVQEIPPRCAMECQCNQGGQLSWALLPGFSDFCVLVDDAGTDPVR